MKIYAISLQRYADRRARLISSLNDLGLEYEIFEASDCKNFSTSDLEHCNSQDKNYLDMPNGKQLLIEDKLTPPEMGCALSHIRCYKHILEQGDEQALVIEDDTILLPQIKEAIVAAKKISTEWDIINFSNFYGIKTRPFPKRYYFGENNQYYFQREGWGCSFLDCKFNFRRAVLSTVCYMINRKACERLIALGDPVRIPSDYLLGLIAYHQLRLYRPYPFSSFHKFGECESTIGNERPKHRMVRV